jgi:hypothetical protein
MDFMVTMPPRDALIRAEAAWVRNGYGVNVSTDTTRLFLQGPGLTLAWASDRKVQFVATDEGRGRTRLTVRANKRWLENLAADWVRNELNGTPWTG